MSGHNMSVVSLGEKDPAIRSGSERIPEILCLLSVIILAGIWAFLIFDKVAVSSEGWFGVYSNMILSGKVPYRDFELVLPPLYPYLMSFVTLISGGSLVVLRLLGVFIFIGLAVLSYYIFKLIFPPWVAAVAAVVAVFVIQSENTFIAYDYIRFYDLFNYAAFFLLLRTIVRSYRNEPLNVNLHLLMAGIFCALAILIRQTSGLIVVVYFALFLILLLLAKRSGLKRRNLYYFFGGLAVPILIAGAGLAAAGALVPFIEMTFLAGAKGSIGSMLFAWIPRSLPTLEIMKKITVVMIMLLVILLMFWKARDRPAAKKADYLFYGVFAVAAAVSVIALYFSLDISSKVSLHWYSLITPMFILNLILGLVLVFKAIVTIWKKEEMPLNDIVLLFFCGFVFAVGFGSGTSGGLSLGQGALNFGLIVAVFLDQINKIKRTSLKAGFKTTAMALVIVLLATSVSTKVVTPYFWWGLEEEPYPYATYETDIDYFKGIKLTAEEKYVYEDFVLNANIHLDDDDELYCYAQIAMFYILAGKLPTVKAAIPWFDVARDKTMMEDLEYLQNNNPKMIMFADHGYTALETHEELYRQGGEMGHRHMYEWLLDCRDDPGSNYIVIETYDLQNYKMYLMLRK